MLPQIKSSIGKRNNRLYEDTNVPVSERTAFSGTIRRTHDSRAPFRPREMEPIVVSRTHFPRPWIKRSAKDVQPLQKEQVGVRGTVQLSRIRMRGQPGSQDTSAWDSYDSPGGDTLKPKCFSEASLPPYRIASKLICAFRNDAGEDKMTADFLRAQSLCLGIAVFFLRSRELHSALLFTRHL
jgi:hypothetical protein